MHPADHPGAGSDPGASAPILQGVTVIDLASWIAGPGAATILRPDKEWAPFTRAVGRPELCSDPRFATLAARREPSPALVAILDGAFTQRDYAEWRQILSAHGVTFGPVARLDDMAGDRQMAAMDVIAQAGAGFPGGRTVMSPIQVDGVTKSSPGRGPDVGEHTDLVLGRLGYDAAAIARLREAGALG